MGWLLQKQAAVHSRKYTWATVTKSACHQGLMTQDMRSRTLKAQRHSPQLTQLELRQRSLQEEALWYSEVCAWGRRQGCDGDGNHSKVAVSRRSSGPSIRCRRQEWLDCEIHQWCRSRRAVFCKNHGRP